MHAQLGAAAALLEHLLDAELRLAAQIEQTIDLWASKQSR